MAPIERMSTGIECLLALVRWHGCADALERLVEERGLRKGPEPEPVLLVELAEACDLDAEARALDWAALAADKPFPSILRLDNGNYVIAQGLELRDGVEHLLVLDPLGDKHAPLAIGRERLEASWSGSAVCVTEPALHTLVECFVLVARKHNRDVSLRRLVHDYAIGPEGLSSNRFMRIVSEQGFKIRSQRLEYKDLGRLSGLFPVVARLASGEGVLILGLDASGGLHIADPSKRTIRSELVEADAFSAVWDGEVYLIKPRTRITDPDQPFGLRWFIPEFIRQKWTFTDVGVAVIAMQCIGLVTPIFFQVVIDKVLIHEAYSTLHVLGVGVVVAIVFDAVFQFLRGQLMLHGTSKIDVRVATKTFGKLVSLPLQFFEARPSGVLIKHMQQVETIRGFLSGRLFFTLLDSVALVIFLPVLFFYCARMATMVLGVSLLIALVMALMLPHLRRRLLARYEAEGARQSFLVESIHGMETVKSLSLEPYQRKEWDDITARSIVSNLRVGRITVTASAITSFLEKAMMVAIPWWGVHIVLDGGITVGALIAFQMLAGRVIGPLVHMVTLIQEYQDVALSVRMLGTIMNADSERAAGQRGLAPPLRGDVTFDDIAFSYSDSSAKVLAGISLDIKAGEVVGIVGRSGSGKSTLMRLLQGLYSRYAGTIRVDGLDINIMDLTHLRSRIGVVLQDSFLFSGTVRDNIRVTRPDAPLEKIVQVATHAGAHEFIERLPNGYDTVLEENGGNLSGGQRQRLAIARALLADPKILILDEATSALDSESEAIIQANLGNITKNRTVIMVSHRLSMLTGCNKIVILDKGKVVGMGTHEQLLSPGGCEVYQRLWRSQHRHLDKTGRMS